MSSSCLQHRNFRIAGEGKGQNIKIEQEKSIVDHRSLGLRRNWLHINMGPVTKLLNRASVEFWTLPSASGEIKHNTRTRIRNVTFLLPTCVNISLPTMRIKTVPSYFSCTGIHIFYNRICLDTFILHLTAYFLVRKVQTFLCAGHTKRYIVHCLTV